MASGGLRCKELLHFLWLLDVPFEVGLAERLAGHELLAGEVDRRFWLLDLVDQATMARSWMSRQVPPGAPTALRLDSGCQGLGAQCDPAAVPGAGRVGVVPAVVALAAGHHSHEPIVTAVVGAELVPAAVGGPAAPFVADRVDETGGRHEGRCAQRSSYQHRHEEVRDGQEWERPALPLHELVLGQVAPEAGER